MFRGRGRSRFAWLQKWEERASERKREREEEAEGEWGTNRVGEHSVAAEYRTVESLSLSGHLSFVKGPISVDEEKRLHRAREEKE